MCNDTRLEDLRFMGSFFTWSNMREGEHRITTKIDRALVNEKWGCVFGNSIANFLPQAFQTILLVLLSVGLCLHQGKSLFGSSTFGLTMKISLAFLVRLGKKKLGVPLCINWPLN